MDIADVRHDYTKPATGALSALYPSIYRRAGDNRRHYIGHLLSLVEDRSQQFKTNTGQNHSL